MKLRNLALMSALLSTSVFATDYLRGTLEKSGDGIVIVTNGTKLDIVANETILKSLPSLESPSYVTQSNGKKYTG